MTDSNKRTPLYDSHLSAGARMVPFGGWDMPVQYSGIISEVESVRTKVGIFDVSHMGRLYISGPSATEFLDWMLTGSASNLRIGRARYCMICNPVGGVIDDTIFYKLEEQNYLLIPNAGNRDAVVDWFNKWNKEKFGNACNISDKTVDTGLLAVQGPDAVSLIDELFTLGDGADPSSLRLFSSGEGTWKTGPLKGKSVFMGRTGYTGEDGFELVVDKAMLTDAWGQLVNSGTVPAGLGARDVLRLEAGLPLHGHEIDEATTPIEAGLNRFVKQSGEFIGSEVLHNQIEQGTEKKLIGLHLMGRSAPRVGYPISFEGGEIGHITSGSYSPTLDKSIAMGYVLDRYVEPGTILDLDIRGRTVPVTITDLPFYTRTRRT